MKFLQETRLPPSSDGLVEVRALYERADGRTIPFLFAIPGALCDAMTKRTDHWFVLGVTAAFAANEDYEHKGAVCSVLRRNMVSLTRQWGQFFPGRRVIDVQIDGDLVEPSADQEERGVACLYTGGVDSSFTMCRIGGRVSTLLSARFAFDDRVLDVYRREPVAQSSEAFKGKEHLLIATNLVRPFAEFGDAWSYLTHGPALISIAHMFAPKVSRVVVSSSHAYGQLLPWGSHPLTDPLLSSASVEVEHYGATYSRFEKVLAIAQDNEAVAQLVVCGKPFDQKQGLLNCSECQKCLRTMVALDLANVDKSQCRSFEWSGFSAQRIAGMTLYHRNEVLFMEELLEAAQQLGREDITEPVKLVLARSSRYKVLAATEGMVRRRFPTIVAKVGGLRKIKRFVVRT